MIGAWRRFVDSERDDLPQDSARELTSELGAGQLLLGSVVGTDSRVALNASVVDVASGRVRGTAAVEGVHDSLPNLVDRLTKELLILSAGEEEQRLAGLTSTSLPALRAYLDGKSLFRQGLYEDSYQAFARALEIDSTFALAGMGLYEAATFTPRFASTRGLELAWAARERLGRRDLALLNAMLGPRHPEPSPVAEQLSLWEQTLPLVSERPNAWYHAADVYFHQGARAGHHDWQARAAAYFQRAVELDSSYTPALMHLVELKALAGDAEGARTLARRYVAKNPTGGTAEHLRWYIATISGDSTALRQLRSEFEQMHMAGLYYIGSLYGNIGGMHPADRDRAMEVLSRRPGTAEERGVFLRELHAHQLERGRPRAAESAAEALQAIGSAPGGLVPRLRVLSALYSAGDTTAAEKALGTLQAQSADAERRYDDLCILEQWRLWHGDTSAVPRTIQQLRAAAPNLRGTASERIRMCAVLLDALFATRTNRPDARARVAELDVLLRTGPAVGEEADYANLVAARLLAQHGDAQRALAASRRRRFGIPFILFLPEQLREEGRLAALTGDRAGAIQAYRQYLAIRSNSEPTVRPEVDRVRAELAQLTNGRP